MPEDVVSEYDRYWYDFWAYLSSPLERELWDRYEDRRYPPPWLPSVQERISHVEMIPIEWISADNNTWPPADTTSSIFDYNRPNKERADRVAYGTFGLELEAQRQQIGLEGRLFAVHSGPFVTEITVNINVTAAVEKYGRNTPITLLTGDKDAPFHRGMLSMDGKGGILTSFQRPNSIIYRIAFYNGAGTDHHPRTPVVLRLDYDTFYLNRIHLPAGLGRELFKDHDRLSDPADTGTVFYETGSSGSLAKNVVSCFRGLETRKLNDPRNGLRFIRHLASSISTW